MKTISGIGYLIGIDGGGTHTRAVLVDATGQVWGKGETGPSNFGNVGIETAQANIEQAVQACWRQAGIAPRPADAAFLGMAGVISEADQGVIRQIVECLNLASLQATGVDHDIRIALAGGLAGAPGIAVIIGTGSSCYGRNALGANCRVGGWGHLLDDGGSGYFLGMQAMSAAVRSADGRGPASSLVPGLLHALGIKTIDQIMLRLYFQSLSHTEIAALAPLVLEAAQQDDAVALQIIQRGVQEIALLVEVAARRLEFTPADVQATFTGGIVRSSALYREILYAEVQRRLPAAAIIEPRMPPVLGAALLAREILERPVSPQFIEALAGADGL